MMIGSSATAAVPAEDVTLVPIVSDNLPIHYTLTGYTNLESRLDSSLNQMPLFTPYDHKEDDWWDNLVAEQLQARMPVMLMSTRGVFDPNDPDDWDGSLNPRELVWLIDAFDRAGVTPELMKVACFVDTPIFQKHYVDLLGLPASSNVDFSDTNNVAFTYFERGIQPWFDTVPREWWFTVDMDGVQRPLIQFWSFHPSWADNMQGNVSTMLTNVANRFENEYGVRPVFNMPSRLVTSGNQDSTVANQADVYAMNNWFIPSTDESYTIVTHNGVTAGAMCPGFAEGTYWSDPGHPHYQNPDHFIARNGSDGLGSNGDTLIEGLDAMMSNGAKVVSIEGWTDDVEYAGLYRSLDAEWTNPNQYINIMRNYNDLRTETLRLELEGADAYYDTTSGNSGNQFRRSGDLDIQKLPGTDGGWNVGWVASGEWMEFRDVNLAPGTYTFSLRYAANSTKNVSLSVDGVSLGNVALPSTGGTTVYDTFSLGSTSVLEGTHTLRLTSASSGGLNLDWMFVKREMLSVSLKSSLNDEYVTAVNGGAEQVQADSTIVGNHQEFIICDRNGGALESGDLINIQSRNGLYLSARAGGNNDLDADRLDPKGWEEFTVLKANGSGTITSGTEIVLQSTDGDYVRTASSGLLDVRGTTIEDATTFRMATFLHSLPSVNINFQPVAAAVPSGYLADTSELFGDRGNGFTYGWTESFDVTRERNTDPDQRLDTLNHTQAQSSDRVWEIDLPNGDYSVSITGGDPDFDNSFIEFVAQAGTADEVTLVSGDAAGVNTVSDSAAVTVSNGLLSISNGANAVNNKINFVDISGL